MTRVLWILTLVITLAAVSPASADTAGVVVTGEPTLQPQVVAEIEGWLRAHDHQVVASPLDADSLNALIDCFVVGDEGCARSVVDKAATSDAIVYARIDVVPNEDGSRNVLLHGYWVAKHASVAHGDNRQCDRCTAQMVRGRAIELISALAPYALQTSPELVEVRSVPPMPVLAPSSSSQDTPASVWHRPMVQAAVVGVGVALGVSGGVMIAMGRDKPSLAGPQPATYLDYRPAGVLFAGLGVAAIAAGGYLWFRDHGFPTLTTTSQVASSSRGALVGWSGRF